MRESSGKHPGTFFAEHNSCFWGPAIFSGGFRWVLRWPWPRKLQSSKDVKEEILPAPPCSLGKGPEILMELSNFFA